MDEQKIIEFLEGKLNPEEEASFKKQLASDPDLRAKMPAYEKIVASFKRVGLDRKKQARLEKKRVLMEGWDLEKIVAAKPSSVYPAYVRPLLVAASVALVILAGIWFFNSSNKIQGLSWANEIYEDLTPEIAIMMNADPKEQYDMAALAFRDRKYDLAIQLLQLIQVPEVSKDTFAQAQYLLGHSYLKADSLNRNKETYRLALACFDNTDAVPINNLLLTVRKGGRREKVTKNDLYWYRALCHLANEDFDTTISLLKSIDSSINEADTIYSNRANILLSRLEK